MEGIIKLRARRSDMCTEVDTVKFYLIQKLPDGRKAVGRNITMETGKIGENREIESILTLEMHEAQQLIDDLWETGLRPTEGTGSAGSMKAVQDHNKDMREVALKLLNIVTK